MSWRRWLVTIALIALFGVPAAARFYPPPFEEFGGQLPVTLILTWMGRLGILLLGFSLGWVVRAAMDPEIERSPERGPSEGAATEAVNGRTGPGIEGCIEIDGTGWKGTAEEVNGELTIRVENKATCPECQTAMAEKEFPGYWTCEKCGHNAFVFTGDDTNYGRAKHLFESEVRRIFTSDGKPYSLDTLLDGIDGEPTPSAIWEAYAQIVQEPHVSTNCFQ